MFINRINGVTNPNFKGYQHVKNETGETVLKFNYPYNYKNEDCELVFYKVTPTENYNYKVDEKPIYTVKMKPEGVNVNLQDVTNLDKEEAIAYKVVRKDKNGKVIWEGPDTGVQMRKLNDNEYGFRVHQDYKWDTNQTKDGKFIPTHEYLDGPTDYAYTLLTRNGTTPTVQGAAYLAIPDSFKPGMKYKGFDDPNTGEIYYDKDYQKEMEGVIKSFSNRFGGGIAGLQAGIPYLKKSGYKLLFSLPTANGDDKSAPGYWNKNNFQVSPDMGNLENYKSFLKELYRNGMGYVYDGTFTSEGLEGIHFQYALRWANRNPQTYYWFRLNGLKDTSIGLGVLPTKADTLAHRIINAPYNYELQSDGTYKAVANPDYKSDRETLVQIYDKTQVSENQIKSLDNAIKTYQRLKAGNELDKITYDDTLINYVFQIDPKEYKDRINVINDLNKNFGKNIKLDTPDGTIMACTNSDGKIKAFVGNPHVHYTYEDTGKLGVGLAVGNQGTLQVIKDMGLKEPFVGTVPIQTGEIGEDFSYYFMVSEQIPSVVSLGVLVDTTNEILSSGGFIIQLLPEASDEDISYIEEKMRNFPAVSALLNEGHTPEEILQMIFEDVKILDSQDLFFECDCSKEKMKNALMTVGKDEIQAMIDEDHGCEMTCQFCNSKYSFSEDELKELLESIQ